MDQGEGGGRAAAAPYLAAAAICAAFAFVGLDASSYSIDELFALFAFNHDGGLGEVVRRALTDTHPPAYYLLAYGWAAAFGSGEAAMRTLSAICAVAALPVLFFGLRGQFSLPARAFAVALAAGSRLFFEEAQEVRNYAPGLLISAGLLTLTLAIHRRATRGEAVGWGRLAGFWALGLAGAFTHFYLFLEVGAVHLFLLLTARRLSLKGLVVASGLTIAAPALAYIAALLHSSQQDMQHMWFSNDPANLAKQVWGGVTQAWTNLALGAVAVLLVAALARRRTAGPPMAPLALSGLAIGLVVAGGLAVSFLLAPSVGRKNLIFLGPFFWTIGAWLYDAASLNTRRAGGFALAALVAVLACSTALTVRTRPLPRNEEWRASAAYVEAIPACRGAVVPVVLPFVFGPSTPFFRDLAQRYFFGRYAAHPERLVVLTPEEFGPAAAPASVRDLIRTRARGGGCPVLAWGVHDLEEDSVAALRLRIAATAGVAPDEIAVRVFERRRVRLLGFTEPRASAYVFETAR